MRLFKCDKCLKEIKESDCTTLVKQEKFTNSCNGSQEMTMSYEKHLCFECNERFYKWLEER